MLGYARQSEFLTNLAVPAFVEALETKGLSSARRVLDRVAMTLVDAEEYGDLKVLAHAKGLGAGIQHSGVARRNQ